MHLHDMFDMVKLTALFQDALFAGCEVWRKKFFFHKSGKTNCRLKKKRLQCKKILKINEKREFSNKFHTAFRRKNLDIFYIVDVSLTL